MLNRKPKPIENTQGFTLIELVVVIVLIGILSAAALPKFAGFSDSARQAVNKGVASALSSGVLLARSQWLATNSNPASISVAGTTVAMSASGYPSATNVAACVAMWNALIQTPTAAASGCTGQNCYNTSSVSAGSCTFTPAVNISSTPLLTIVYEDTNGTVITTP